MDLAKRPPIRSPKYLSAAKGQPCTFQIPSVCIGGTETTVACHIRDEHTGRAVKASDCSVADGCSACHDLIDGRSGTLSDEEWEFYARRGLQRTLENRIRRGIVVFPVSIDKSASERAVRPRKAKEQRAKINGRSDWPSGRQLQSRNNLRKEPAE